MATLKERRPDQGRTATAPDRTARPDGTASEATERWPSDVRARRFADLDSWIMARERARISTVWDVSAEDRRLRLQGLESRARRQGQLAESARRAQAVRASSAT